MLSVKEATQAARRYFDELYEGGTFSGVLLEEVERSEDQDAPYWFITLGFADKSGKTSSSPLKALARPRRYKEFKINAETGEVEAMKIRAVGDA